MPDIHERTNILLGVRYDGSRARNTEFAAFNPTPVHRQTPVHFSASECVGEAAGQRRVVEREPVTLR